jgi:hypothetical protein
MKIVRMSAMYLAILAGIAATMISMPAGNRAQAAVCPFVLYEACVKEKDGFIHTEWTNGCFAKERGAKILYRGACKGK